MWVGGDSAGVAGEDIRCRADAKVFKNEDFLFGCCGSFRMINLLKYDFLPPENEYGIPGHEFISTLVVEELRRCFRDGGLMRLENSAELGGTFLLGYKAQLYYVDADFQVGLFYEPYAAVGSGSQYALGSVYSLRNAAPRRRIQVALEAAENFCSAVRKPFTILHT